MASFKGPWSKDIDSFKKSVESMPEKYKKSFKDASRSTVEKICAPEVLHIWESDSDIDGLLQLTFVIAKLCNLGMREEKGSSAKNGSMLIIAEEKTERNNFSRICQLVAYLTCANGKKHLEGTVCAYGKIVVVKGWNNSILPNGTCNKEAAEKVVKRINVAIDHVFKMGNFVGAKRKIVWHHGAIIHFLLHWINNTTSTLRSALYAITVTGSLQLTNSIAPSAQGRSNTLPDLARLEEYAEKLGVPVVFLDASSQLITGDYLGVYIYYYGYYINAFLPPSLSRPHLDKAQDELVTFAFRLRAASEGKYGSEAVKTVQKHLDASKAKSWAKTCIDKDTYEKTKCRAAAKDSAIHHAVHLADSPFALLSHANNLPAFARLLAGPTTGETTNYFIAAPVHIDFRQARLRPRNPSPFFLLLPAPHQDVGKVTSGIQGLMAGVLERIRREKGNPRIGQAEGASWKAVVKACTWAIDGCKGKLPDGVPKKVEFVKEKFKHGTFGYVLACEEKEEEEGGGGGNKVGIGQGNVGVMGSGMGSGIPYPQYPQMQGIQQIGGNQASYGMPMGYAYAQGTPGWGHAQQQQPMSGGGYMQSRMQPSW